MNQSLIPIGALTDHLPLAQLKLAAAAVLLSPYVPLLFMGEEYGERNPFPYFVDFKDPALIKSVREGRAAGFREFLAERETIPDPEALQGRSRDTMIVHPAAGSVLMIERKIVSDRVFIFFNFGDRSALVTDVTTEQLRPVFQPEATAVGMIGPWSVLVCEPTDNPANNPPI